MEYLPLLDRISASQTCRLWHEANRISKLHKNEIVFIQDNLSTALKYLAPESPVKSILPTPCFTNFSFKNVEVKFTGEMRNFWPIYGPTLKSLYLKHCDISEKALTDCLRSCPLLETLHLNGCNDVFMSGKVLENVVHDLRMPCLAEIGLIHSRYISDSILNRFIMIAPNLSRLVLDDCRISFNNAVYLRFYPELHRQSINSEVLAGILPLHVQKNVLTLQNILNILILRADNITWLSLGCTLIDNHGLKQICTALSQTCIKLETLRLVFSGQLRTGIEDISKHFSTSLKCLDLSYCRSLSSTSLAELPKLKSLTSLNLQFCSELSDSTVRQFGCLANLKSLNLSSIEKLTGPAILEGLKKLQHMEHLYLNNLTQLDSESLLELLKTLPPLRTLELESCQVPMLDAALSILCQRHKTVTNLHLARCQMMSDIGLTGMEGIQALDSSSENTTNFMKISLASKAEQHIVSEVKRQRTIVANLQPYEQQLLEENENAIIGIANLKSLKCLDLSNCNKISDVSVIHTFKFKEIRSLNLENNTNITDVSLQCLAVNCPSLTYLNLTKCIQITDQGICCLSHLARLKSLILEGCTELGDASLEALMQTKSPLKYVDFCNCDKLSPDAVKKFSDWLNQSIRWSESTPSTSAIPSAPTWPTCMVSGVTN